MNTCSHQPSLLQRQLESVPEHGRVVLPPARPLLLLLLQSILVPAGEHEQHLVPRCEHRAGRGDVVLGHRNLQVRQQLRDQPLGKVTG